MQHERQSGNSYKLEKERGIKGRGASYATVIKALPLFPDFRTTKWNSLHMNSSQVTGCTKQRPVRFTVFTAQPHRNICYCFAVRLLRESVIGHREQQPMTSQGQVSSTSDALFSRKPKSAMCDKAHQHGVAPV